MPLAFPLVAWGAPDDISAAPWTSAGTPIVTGGQADPFGGTGATLIEDDSAVGPETRVRAIAGGTLLSSLALVAPCFRQGTATQSAFVLRDPAAGVNRIFWTATWAGGVPSLAVSNGSVVGTPVALGGGWYAVICFSAAVNPAVTNNLTLYGANSAGGGSSNEVGSTYWYLRNLVLLDVPDNDRAWRPPREGSKQVRSRSGIADSHIKGWDYRFRGKLRWIPREPRSFPIQVSGYEGLNELVGVNCGVAAMLKAGQESQSLLWVPDRSIASVNIPSTLTAPWEDPYDHDNAAGERTFDLELVNTATPYPTVV